MKIVIASDNKKKLKEMNEILSGLGYSCISKSDAGIYDEVEETGTTFTENSILKAKEIAKKAKTFAVADDSGLMVDALNGEPGVYSKRYAGENATDEERISFLLNKIKNVPDGKRTAKFISAVSFYNEEGKGFTVTGECKGSLSFSPKGSGGFGYDPIFVPDGYNKTFSELTSEEKAEISHRGKALRLFKEKLTDFLKTL